MLDVKNVFQRNYFPQTVRLMWKKYILVDIQSRNFNRHENQFKPDSRHEVINFILAVLF